ncbi:sulfotransferase family 2 domain-containing protein [Parasedimentitalea huanghaiensis]|uniref:Sulfotransferase family protein n=1 Tax=Parasedimentitalea huanghaiensis TaxID=2682100 RepID=A0A6L6WM05_9RHOB|nr:sulfotransferase family 2 domain-containing protein [Zongyanglinia huanghaiensis]MVO18521.1 hypothetical protein [Zongyanglinia huanghaiensis]
MKPLKVFVHLPKCGGTSVDANLRHHYGDRFFQYVGKKDNMAFKQHQKTGFRNVEIMTIHNGLFKYETAFEGIETSFFSVCRDPVSAAVSMFNFATTAKHTQNYTRVKGLDFWQFMSLSHKIPIWAPNFQSYYLAGQRSWQAVQARLVALDLNMAALADLNAVYHDMTGHHMDPTLDRNKSEKRLNASDLSPKELSIVTELFDVDMRLWDQVMAKGDQ